MKRKKAKPIAVLSIKITYSERMPAIDSLRHIVRQLLDGGEDDSITANLEVRQHSTPLFEED